MVSRPAEASISEGNLVENPIFVLNNREAKPKDKAKYAKWIQLTPLRLNGLTVERTVRLNASTEFGFPTMFGYRVLLAIIQEAYRRGLQTPTVSINRHQIALALGYRSPSRKDYENIENACNAMAAMYIQFRGTWYDGNSLLAAQDRDGVHLLERVHFRDERRSPLPGLAEEIAGRGYVVLGELLFQSLRAGYFNGVDLQYINALAGNPLAQRLYAYLTKKDNAKTSFTIGLRELAAKFNMKKRSPSALYDAFQPALALLASAMLVGDRKLPRRFLETWNIDRRKVQLTVNFYKEEKEPEIDVRRALEESGYPLAVGAY